MLNRLLGKLYGKKSQDTPKSPPAEAETTAPSASAEGDAPVEIDGLIQPSVGTDVPTAGAATEPPTPPSRATGAPASETSPAGAEEQPREEGEGSIDTAALEAQIAEAIKTIYDPEIPVNIYELGLIYSIKVEPSGMARVVMTLTAPNCPAAGILPGQVESQARSVDGVYDVDLDLTFEPPWTIERMSDAAKLELGML